MHLPKTKKNKFDLLIITPSSFKKTLKKLVSHKVRFNIKTDIITLDEIFNSKFFPLEGRDTPEQIKYFIKNSYDFWKIKYVLLVGGHKQLPVRYIHNFDRYPSNPEVLEPPYISDLYYADIYDSKGNFSTWDSNNDGKFGQWEGNSAQDKNIDLKPNVCIGRLPCKNRFEVKIIIKKIINYELKTYGKPWFKKIVAAGGNTHPEIGNFLEGEADILESLKYLEDFKQDKLFVSKGNLNRLNLIKSINKGCGFLLLVGHSNPPFWTTSPPNAKEFEWIPKFSISHMIFLTNKSKLPILISSGCRNSAFDTNPFNLIKNPYLSYYWMDCIRNPWNWAITRKYSGGAIASLGSSGLGYGKYEPITGGKADAFSFLIPEFFKEYNVNKVDILGQIWYNLIHSYLKKYTIDWNTPSLDVKTNDAKPDVINARTVQQFILLGDPTLKIGGYKK